MEGGHLAHVKVEKDKEEVVRRFRRSQRGSANVRLQEKGIVPVGGDHGADQRQVNHEEVRATLRWPQTWR